MGINAQPLKHIGGIFLILLMTEYTTGIFWRKPKQNRIGSQVDCCKMRVIPIWEWGWSQAWNEWQWCISMNLEGENCKPTQRPQTPPPPPPPPPPTTMPPLTISPASSTNWPPVTTTTTLSTKPTQTSPGPMMNTTGLCVFGHEPSCPSTSTSPAPPSKKPTNAPSTAAPTMPTPQSTTTEDTCIMGDEPSCTVSTGNPEIGSTTDKIGPEDVNICRAFDNWPMECRSVPDCFYICEDRRCDVRRLYENGPLTKQRSPNGNGSCTMCSQHCFDLRRCKESGCEYHVTSGNCRGPAPIECSRWIFAKDECAWNSSVHSNGGELCYVNHGFGTCKIAEVITAVNFNANDTITDTKGIIYLPHTQVKVEDPHSLISQVGHSKIQRSKLIKKHDIPIYMTHVVGHHEEPGHCANYYVNITRDGVYNLGIKMQEPLYTERGKRFWSVRVNGIFTAPEIDVWIYAEKDNYGFDLILPFWVEDGRRKLSLKGFGDVTSASAYPPDTLVEEIVLSFCRGSYDNANNSFTPSAFYLIRLSDSGDIDGCQNLDNNPCSCVDKDCLFNGETGKCRESSNDCSKIVSARNECRRTNAYYVVGSHLCYNTVERGNCSDGELVWAVNGNGEKYTDNRNITYSADSTMSDLIEDLNGIKLAVNIQKECTFVLGVSDKDVTHLYHTVVSSAKNSMGCVTYPLPICSDGRFELSLKMVDYSSNSANTRRFNVKLNIVTVLMEVDILRHCRRCEPIEFIILFEIRDSGRKLKIEGHPEVAIDHSDLKLSFCTGGCEEIPNQEFVFSAFSVEKLGSFSGTEVPSGKCAEQTDVCNCKFKGCEFDTVQDTCEDRKAECGLCDFDVEDCRRADSWYSTAAVLCKNTINRGNCIVEKSVIGVNLGGAEQTDRGGILHKGFASLPPTTRDPGQQLKVARWKLEGIHQKDLPLFETYITGRNTNKWVTGREGTCTRYVTHISHDGKYELSIRVGDFWYTTPKKRSINYIFNGVNIVHELDVRSHTKSRKHGMELNVNFRVYGGSQMLYLRGHPDTPIIDKLIPLQFCYGQCVKPGLFTDDNYVISSFSIIKFKDTSTVGTCGNEGPESNICIAQTGNVCECRKAGCEFHVVTRDCISGEQKCEDCEMDLKSSECRRRGSFYVNGGVICMNSRESGFCGINDTLIALNFGKESYSDKNGILHEAHENVPGHIPGGTILGNPVPVLFALGVDGSDKDLYKSYIHSNPNTPNSKTCLSYDIRFKMDGEYEFSIKMLEYEHQTPGKRTFSIKLNGVVVVEELDIRRMTGENQNIMNVIVNFNVTNNRRTLVLPGYPDSSINNAKIFMEVCNGNCNGVSGLWTLAAFAVVQFGFPLTSNSTCGQFSTNTCDCVDNNCQQSPAIGQCVDGILDCQNYYGSPEDCRRQNGLYSDGGAMCINRDEVGECHSLTTVYAVNLNGRDYVSSTDIMYTGENNVRNSISDPFNIRTQLELNCSEVIGVSEEDAENLFNTATGGLPSTNRSARCFNYTISFCDDGRFELSIKTLVDRWNKSSKMRFSVILENYYVFNEVDIIQLSAQKCKIVELIVLFEIDNGGTLFRIQGYENLELEEVSRTTLQLCYTMCSAEEHSFHVSAFSVVRLGDPVGGPKDSCEDHRGNSCECVKAHCNYQPESHQCTRRKIACQTCAPLQTRNSKSPECRRAGAFYIDGNGVCQNRLAGGNCSIAEVIKAVNFNGPETTSSIGVKHEEFALAIPDRAPAHLEKDTGVLTDDSIPAGDKILYETLIHSDDTATPCIAYDIPVQDDGFYELSVKTWDHFNSEPGKMTMSIRLNQVNIIDDIDIVLIAGQGKTANLIVNFQVAQKSTLLFLDGFVDSNISKNKTIPFEICQGGCGLNIGWVASAFSVIRFDDGIIVPVKNETNCNVTQPTHPPTHPTTDKYHYPTV